MKRLYLFLLTHLQEITSGLKGSNSFMRNVAYNLSGNTIVLIIGFFLTPIIAKIYGPEAYGNFALFAAICSLIAPFSTMQLQAGYVAAKNKIEFFTLVRMSFFALVAISTLSLIGIFLYNNLTSYRVDKIYLSIPIYVFFSGIFIILRGWNIKLQEFKVSAKSKILATILGKSSTLSAGILYTQSAIGIIAGSIVSFITEAMGLVSKKMLIEAKLNLRQKIKFNYYKATLYRFKQYPTYVTLNSIINSISIQLPIYFIASQFTQNNVGLFSLSLSLIQIPLNLMGTSIGAVFLPKIASIVNQIEKRNKTILGLYNKLFYPGVILLMFLAFILGSFLTLLLGNEWQGTSYLSSFMATSFAFGVVALPLSVVYRLINFEKGNLVLTLVFILLKIGGLAIGGLLNDFNLTVFIYFFIVLIQNGLQVILLFKKLKIRIWPVIRDLSMVILIYLFSYYTVNY